MVSDRWDALLNDSTWYVPAANLLAYRLDADSPELPIPAADQTIWSIPEAEGGRFTGQSVAKIVDTSGAVTRSRASMDGVVTRSGQARIVFTTAAGTTITGIGQVRRVNGEQAMEMQMITGGNGAFTTHWAYMLPLTAGTEAPDPRTDQGDQRTYRSGGYRWLRGTSWSLTPRNGDRQQARGRFAITGYRNGYFWGEGTRGRGNRSFQVLGSITPEGNLFFNAIGDGRFQLRISQGGLLTGGRRQASARLRPYSAEAGQLKQPLLLERLTAGSRSATGRRDALTGLDDGGASRRQRLFGADRQDPLLAPAAGAPGLSQSSKTATLLAASGDPAHELLAGWVGLTPTSGGQRGDGALAAADALVNLGGGRPWLQDFSLMA